MSTIPCRRVRVTGTVEIALPLEQAFLLFTPTGERAWAHGWDPIFPSPSADETEPGTVFRTIHGAEESLWTVVRCEFGQSIAYTVATPTALRTGHRHVSSLGNRNEGDRKLRPDGSEE